MQCQSVNFIISIVHVLPAQDELLLSVQNGKTTIAGLWVKTFPWEDGIADIAASWTKAIDHFTHPNKNTPVKVWEVIGW